jgi:2-iminobutanoate/2-iminopropanoate deaminase
MRTGGVPGSTAGRTDMAAQCAQTLENMHTALELLGGSLQDVVQVRAFLPQHCRPAGQDPPSSSDVFNDVYRRHFQSPYPARAAIQHGLFLEDLLVEIEAIAVLGRPKRLIESAALPPLRLPYSQGGIQVGNLLFLRGFTAQDRHGELIGPGDMRAQTEQTFANMAIVLAEAGGTLADLMQTHVTITDWHDYSVDNAVYNRHVRAPFPTRTTVQGGLGREGLLIEIESVATLATPRQVIDAAVPQVGRTILQRRANVTYSDKLAPGLASYAYGVRVGDLLYISGQVSTDAQGRLVGAGDMAVHTRQTLAHLRLVLELAGMGMDDVVKTTVMRTDWRYYASYNAVYREPFAPPYPARSTVCSSLAQKGLLIEISAIAVAGASTSAVVATND